MAAVAAACVALVGCTAAPAQVVTVTATPTVATPDPTANGWEHAQVYSEAVLKGNWEQAKGHFLPGSAADRYIQHQRALEDAQDAAGVPTNGSPDDITFDADAGTVTSTFDGDDLVWKDFEYDSNGLVMSWATGESATPLTKRLWTKPAKATAAKTTVTLVSAYRNDDALWVVLDVKATGRTVEIDCSPLLDDAKGRQRKAASCDAPDKVTKGHSAYVALAFSKADFGGTLRYEILSADYDTLATVKLPIR